MSDKQAKITDKLSRPLTDLRISVTDRCNFRCTYCMPKEVFGPDYAFMPHQDMLTFEEILRLVRIFVELGVRKVRLTGGEPLLRRNLEDLISQIAETKGVDDIALTTNGALLTAEKAKRLKDAGLRRVTISLDSLDDEVFGRMNDVRFPVTKVLRAIDAAAEAGLNPVKVNMVVQKGVNEQSVLPMAEYFRGTGHIVRFIEYMDVGNSNGWRLEEVYPTAELLAAIGAKWPLEAINPNHPGEVATRYRYVDGQGEIGVISSVTRPFCGNCSRARLSASGELYTCLFGTVGHDIRSLLRRGEADETIYTYLQNLWGKRIDRYSELRTASTTGAPLGAPSGTTPVGANVQGADGQGIDGQGVAGQGTAGQDIDAQGTDVQGSDKQGVDPQGQRSNRRPTKRVEMSHIGG